jgi:hypothetical protein
MRNVLKIVIKGGQSHLEFLTANVAKPVGFSRKGRKDQELRHASHPLNPPLLLEIVNSLTFTFAFLPVPSEGCHWQEGYNDVLFLDWG